MSNMIKYLADFHTACVKVWFQLHEEILLLQLQIINTVIQVSGLSMFTSLFLVCLGVRLWDLVSFFNSMSKTQYLLYINSPKSDTFLQQLNVSHEPIHLRSCDLGWGFFCLPSRSNRRPSSVHRRSSHFRLKSTFKRSSWTHGWMQQTILFG